MKPKTIILLVIGVLGLIILIGNINKTVELWFFGKFSISVILLIVIVLVLGFVLGWLGHLQYERKRGMEKKEVKEEQN